MEIESSAADDAVRRLRKIEGQVRGIIGMLGDGRDCRDVVTQLSAASKALDHVSFKLLASGLERCLRDEDEAAAAGYDRRSLEKLFLKLA